MTNHQDKELSGGLHAAVIAHCEDLESSAPTLRENRFGPVADAFLKASAELREALADSPQLPVAEQPAGQAVALDEATLRSVICKAITTFGHSISAETISLYRGKKDGVLLSQVIDEIANAIRPLITAAPHSPVAQMSGYAKLMTRMEIMQEHKALVDSGDYDMFAFARRIEEITLRKFASHPSNAVQDAPADERDVLIQKLQTALDFWLPRMPDSTEWPDIRAVRIEEDSYLLCGSTDQQKPCAEDIGWITLNPVPKNGKPQTWATDGGYKCLNCGAGLTAHQDQRKCPTSAPAAIDVRDAALEELMRDGAEVIATEAFRHALNGGHIHDLYKLPHRMNLRRLLAALQSPPQTGKESQS